MGTTLEEGKDNKGGRPGDRVGWPQSQANLPSFAEQTLQRICRPNLYPMTNMRRDQFVTKDVQTASEPALSTGSHLHCSSRRGKI